ncbi:MAG: polysaccharide deacetylase family protein, partial [Pseudomonadales bacterium]
MNNNLGLSVTGSNMQESQLVNAFTVDVEDYFQVSAFEEKISRDGWERIDTRIERNIDKLLAVLDEFSVKGTFFVLGWVAEHYPNVIKNIAVNGHEIASHGYWHRRATQQTKVEFEKDVLAARNILQDLTGESIEGYRAPSFSIDKSNDWAYDVLSEIGHTYS